MALPFFRRMCPSSFLMLLCGGGGLLMFAALTTGSGDTLKRSFSGLGCMGVYDKAKFARLDRICEDCYQLYREADVHTLCRSNCFKNNFFSQCVDVLLLQQDQQQLGNLVDEVYGK